MSLKRLSIIALVIVLILISAFFASRNYHTVSFDIIFMQLEWPLILILLVTFFVGFLLSWILNAWLLFMQKRQIKQLNKQLADYKQEVSQLRQSPMNGMQ